jgi:uncharacterized membrane protein YczE
MKFARKLCALVVGLSIFALGLVFAINANLGLAPWNCLSDGVSKRLPLTFGQANILVSFVMLAVNLAFRQKIGLATVANMSLVGTFVDIFRTLPLPRGPGAFGPEGAPSAWGIACGIFLILCGLAISALGSILYLGAGFGAGPRDGLMLALMRATGKSLAFCRVSLEAGALALGFALGGSVGIGTVIASGCNGPVMQFVFKRFGFKPDEVRHIYLDDQWKAALKRKT